MGAYVYALQGKREAFSLASGETVATMRYAYKPGLSFAWMKENLRAASEAARKPARSWRAGVPEYAIVSEAPEVGDDVIRTNGDVLQDDYYFKAQRVGTLTRAEGGGWAIKWKEGARR